MKRLLRVFNDDNDINEKNIIGLIAFTVVVVFGITDLVMGIMGLAFIYNVPIFNAFVYITLGAFGLGEVKNAIGCINSRRHDSHYHSPHQDQGGYDPHEGHPNDSI